MCLCVLGVCPGMEDKFRMATFVVTFLASSPFSPVICTRPQSPGGVRYQPTRARIVCVVSQPGQVEVWQEKVRRACEIDWDCFC